MGSKAAGGEDLAQVRQLRPELPPPPSGPPSSSRSSTDPRPSRKLPAAPSWLSPTGKAAFRQLVEAAEAVEPGWLERVDVPLLAMFADVYATAQAAAKSMRGAGGHARPIDHDRAHAGRPRKHPGWQVVREAAGTMRSLGRELGVTPAMRRQLDLDGTFGAGDGGPDPELDGDADLFD